MGAWILNYPDSLGFPSGLQADQFGIKETAMEHAQEVANRNQVSISGFNTEDVTETFTVEPMRFHLGDIVKKHWGQERWIVTAVAPDMIGLTPLNSIYGSWVRNDFWHQFVVITSHHKES